MFNPVVLNQVAFTWPDGTPCLRETSVVFSAGFTGIVGRNGSGKSTLLKLISGELKPTQGSVTVEGTVGVLPQNLTGNRDAQVADLLGIAAKLDAIGAIEAGDLDAHLFDVIGDDWAVESRATQQLAATGFDVDLDRSVETLSGGEAMLLAIVGLKLAGNPITLLDEPTNNLDRTSRERLYQLLQGWAGTLIVVSHDVGLLRQVDQIAELRDGRVSSYGGNWDDYLAQVDSEQEAARRRLASAEQRLRVEKLQQAQAQEKLAHRQRLAAKRASEGVGKMAQHYFANRAQRSGAKLRRGAEDQIAAAADAIELAESKVRDETTIRIDLPDPLVAASRRLAEFVDSAGRSHLIRGPERVALVGPNGVGKTVLISNLLGLPGQPPSPVATRLLTDRVGHLPQRLDEIDDESSVLDNVLRVAPAVTPGEIRDRLARMGLRGDTVHRPVMTLSGGERFKAVLASLLLAEPPAQLIVLDEPTNNLDIDTVTVLVEALSGYRGALLVVSHDEDFLRRLGTSRYLELSRSGVLADSLSAVNNDLTCRDRCPTAVVQAGRCCSTRNRTIRVINSRGSGASNGS